MGAYITHGFLWDNGRMRDLGVSPRGFTTDSAVAINDHGQILGAALG